MRAVQVTEFGGPEVLKPVELPDPEPGPGQQLIEVSRIGVNYADTDQKALIYVRLSSYAGESDTTTSPARQEEECRQWCAVNGYEVVEVIKDLDVSGSDKGLRLDRPGLLQVRQTIAGEPTLKIVEDFNAKGVASPEGKGWGSDTIRKLLRRRSSGGCRSTGARSCAASTGCRSGLTRRS
jgi:hypothetical protein